MNIWVFAYLLGISCFSMTWPSYGDWRICQTLNDVTLAWKKRLHTTSGQPLMGPCRRSDGSYFSRKARAHWYACDNGSPPPPVFWGETNGVLNAAGHVRMLFCFFNPIPLIGCDIMVYGGLIDDGWVFMVNAQIVTSEWIVNRSS